MSGLYVRIEGLEAIEKALSDLEPAQIKKTLAKASAAGGKVVRAAMKAQLNGRGTGKLRGSVRYKAMRRSTTHLVGHVVSPMGRFGSARALVEYGHAGPHAAPAHPFIQPAFEASQGAAEAAMEQVLFEVLKEF